MILFRNHDAGPVLHFVHLSGCESCAKAEVAVDAVIKASPRIRLNRIDVSAGGKSPVPVTYVPSFVFQVGDFKRVWEIENKKDIPNSEKLAAWVLESTRAWWAQR